MIIAFPPCTHLTVAGARWFPKKRENGEQRFGVWFFCQFLKADCDRIAIENPVGIMSGEYVSNWYPDLAYKYGVPIQYTQVIQPYEYGHNARKKTCLWLKNLPKLVPTEIVDCGKIDEHGLSYGAGSYHAVDDEGKILAWDDPMTAKIRSRTYEGVGKAMVSQWVSPVCEGYMDEKEQTLF